MNTKLLAPALAIAALALSAHGALAAHFREIHQFCPKSKCTDGAEPWSVPSGDGAGNYFGSTTIGGAFNGGAVYEMSFTGGRWHQTVIYSFCAKSSCPDGASPQGNLVIDTAGNLYGAAKSGGKNNAGVVFELSPGAKGWTYQQLYGFCAQAKCADGAQPIGMTLIYQGAASGMKYDGTSPLYGTTAMGGSVAGVVFSLKPSHGGWTQTVIYDFCKLTNCTDGLEPVGGVTPDGAGNLFGTTAVGGKYNKGTLWEMQPSGKSWTLTTLHHFCADQNACVDGQVPEAPMIVDGNGTLFGTVAGGGSGAQGGVFQLVPNGRKSKYTMLYAFCQQASCTDGAVSISPLALDASGRLFGVTQQGGANNFGSLFRLSGPKYSSFATLLSFGGTTSTGIFPDAIALDASGAIFGSMNGGGTNNAGSIFQYTP